MSLPTREFFKRAVVVRSFSGAARKLWDSGDTGSCSGFRVSQAVAPPANTSRPDLDPHSDIGQYSEELNREWKKDQAAKAPQEPVRRGVGVVRRYLPPVPTPTAMSDEQVAKEMENLRAQSEEYGPNKVVKRR